MQIDIQKSPNFIRAELKTIFEVERKVAKVEKIAFNILNELNKPRLFKRLREKIVAAIRS